MQLKETRAVKIVHPERSNTNCFVYVLVKRQVPLPGVVVCMLMC